MQPFPLMSLLLYRHLRSNQQISKEDVAVALELGRAADEACNTVHKRRLRQYMMDRCAENVETLCIKRKQHHEG